MPSSGLKYKLRPPPPSLNRLQKSLFCLNISKKNSFEVQWDPLVHGTSGHAERLFIQPSLALQGALAGFGMLDIQELNKAICMGAFQAVFSIVTLPLASVSPLCYCRFGVLSVSERVESFTLPLYPPSPALCGNQVMPLWSAPCLEENFLRRCWGKSLSKGSRGWNFSIVNLWILATHPKGNKSSDNC